MKKYYEAFGKKYLIRATAKTPEAANSFCEKYPECSVIDDVEDNNGNLTIIIANNKPE